MGRRERERDRALLTSSMKHATLTCFCGCWHNPAGLIFNRSWPLRTQQPPISLCYSGSHPVPIAGRHPPAYFVGIHQKSDFCGVDDYHFCWSILPFTPFSNAMERFELLSSGLLRSAGLWREDSGCSPNVIFFDCQSRFRIANCGRWMDASCGVAGCVSADKLFLLRSVNALLLFLEMLSVKLLAQKTGSAQKTRDF